MSRGIALIAAGALAACLSANGAYAQMQTGPQGGSANPGEPVAPGSPQMGMTADQFNKLQDYADQAKRLTKDDKASGKTLADLLAEDKANASVMTARMPLSCDVKEAMLATQGPVTQDGKTVNIKTYEATCANGMGYFLISQDPGTPYGISCFAADATRIADVAAGRPPGPVCTLPPNANLNAMATALLAAAGTNCTARDHLWRGQNSKTNTEFEEVACSDNTGYILAIALPGSNAPVRLSTCHDSAMRGLACKLSDNGGALVTTQTFKDALQKHAIACDAGEKDMHVFGQENVQKRYVVEFKCTQRPMGLVTYIPLADAKAPFEAIDCATAAKRGVKCTLTAPKW